VRVFDDPRSILHFLIPLTLTVISPSALLAATIVYLVYEVLEHEPLENKLGDLVEWLTGILVGAFLRLYM